MVAKMEKSIFLPCAHSASLLFILEMGWSQPRYHQCCVDGPEQFNWKKYYSGCSLSWERWVGGVKNSAFFGVYVEFIPRPTGGSSDQSTNCMRNVMFQVGGLLCSMDTWNAVDDFNIDSTICRNVLNSSNRTPYSAVDSTNEVPYRDLKHRSISTICLKQIKPYGSLYGTSVLVSTDSAWTAWKIDPGVGMSGERGFDN